MLDNRIEYQIYSSVYDEMILGKKNVEIRLLNEKSKRIKIGDKIKFQVLDSDLYLIVEVTNKYVYSDINELYKDKDVTLNCVMNYTKEECLNALFQIFGKDKILNSKLVGIEFKILDK